MIELEFHISPAAGSSRPQTAVGTYETSPSRRCATPGSSVTRCGMARSVALSPNVRLEAVGWDASASFATRCAAGVADTSRTSTKQSRVRHDEPSLPTWRAPTRRRQVIWPRLANSGGITARGGSNVQKLLISAFALLAVIVVALASGPCPRRREAPGPLQARLDVPSYDLAIHIPARPVAAVVARLVAFRQSFRQTLLGGRNGDRLLVVAECADEVIGYGRSRCGSILRLPTSSRSRALWA
jgi:hypothetical protein